MGRQQILSLLQRGNVLFNYPLKVYYLEGEGGLVVSVPKRNFKRAVKRNLIRRRIKEAYRLNRNLLNGQKMDMMIVYVGNEPQPYDRIAADVVTIFKKIASFNICNAD